MIVKALESRLVKPVAEHRGWNRIRSRNVLVMEEGTFWFVGEVLDKFSGLQKTDPIYICGSWFPWESSGSTLLVCDQKS